MKLKALFVALAAMFGLFFCSALDAQTANPDKGGTPAHSVKAFFRAMAGGDFAAAKKYVSAKELQDMITAVETLAKEVPELAEESKKEFAPVLNSMKFKSEKVAGDKAEVEVSVVNPENGKTESRKFKLKKINGIWKIEE